MMFSHEPSVAEVRELRERAWQRLAALVPVAIEVMMGVKARLEARINSGKKLSPQDQQELAEIRVFLGRIGQAKACALLNRIGPEEILATLRESGIGTRGAR